MGIFAMLLDFARVFWIFLPLKHTKLLSLHQLVEHTKMFEELQTFYVMIVKLQTKLAIQNEKSCVRLA